jgi:hypothetical protein
MPWPSCPTATACTTTARNNDAPLLHELVASGTLPDSYATDDRVAIVYRDTQPVEVITDVPDTDAAAYRVTSAADGVVEERLAPGPIAP